MECFRKGVRGVGCAREVEKRRSGQRWCDKRMVRNVNVEVLRNIGDKLLRKNSIATDSNYARKQIPSM